MTEGDERGQALSDLAKKVESFVGGKGNVDGATFAEWVFCCSYIGTR